MKFFVERPVAISMVFVALLSLGVYSFLNTPLELQPKAEYPQLTIQTFWHNVPPEIIQTQITAPLEEIAVTVKGVEKITSDSSIGQSMITLDFDPKTNMEFARLALREGISKIKDVLPQSVKPSIVPYVPEQFKASTLLLFTISGNYTIQELRELLKEKIEFGLGSV